MAFLRITRVEFLKRFKEGNFGDTELFIDSEVTISNESINWHHCKVVDVIFQEKLVIRDCEINSGIHFSNCRFEKGVVFHNVKSSNYDSAYNQDNKSVCFENSKSLFIVFENKCFLDRSLTIEKKCKIEKLDIVDLVIRNAGLILINSDIDFLNISKSKIEINLSNSIFHKQTRFESILGDINFIKNEFKEDLMIWNLECPNRFTLNYNQFKDTFKIESSRIELLTIIGDTFDKKVEFENRELSTNNNLESYLNKLYISEARFIEGIDFNGLGKNLEELNLIITPELKGVLNFDNWIIERTVISGINQNLKLLFKSIKFRFLFINDFTNFSDISFDRCKGNGDEAILNLINSDLGSTRFNEFNLKSFKVLRLNNVSIDKIRPSNVYWFDESQVEIEVHEQSESEKAKRKREIYRQLKQALKNHGNQIDSLIFQARELKCLRDELYNSKKYGLGERLIMFVNQSNDYGLNWLKPVGIVFAITFLLYITILPGISDKILFSFSFVKEDIVQTWNVFINNFETFWNLFNPVRRFDLTYGEIIQSDWLYFLDFVHRIFLGIMIFQIIKAFRKYVSS